MKADTGYLVVESLDFIYYNIYIFVDMSHVKRMS